MIGGARDVCDGVREEVIARPVTGVPTVNARGERLNGVFESVHGLLLTERDGDVVPAQEGKDAPVEHVRRRIGRILLRERASIEQRGNPAFLVKALEWLEREPSPLRELVLACGEIKANEETRSFALRHRRNPSRLQWKRVAIRMNVDPPASCR